MADTSTIISVSMYQSSEWLQVEFHRAVLTLHRPSRLVPHPLLSPTNSFIPQQQQPLQLSRRHQNLALLDNIGELDQGVLGDQEGESLLSAAQPPAPNQNQ